MAASLDDMRTELRQAVAQAGSGRAAADNLCHACVGLFDLDGAAVSLIYEGASRGTFGSSSESSRRVDEYQFTYGEGPCLDAVASRSAVLVPDLEATRELRWPVFTGAALGDGIRGVFALPIMVTSACVGALDLFRADPGPLGRDQLAGAALAAHLASGPLLDLFARSRDTAEDAVSGTARRQGEGMPPEELERVEVYQATGMLIAQLDVGAAEAVVRLRAHAMATGLSASQVAFAILDGSLRLDRDVRWRGPDGQDGGGPA
jgi:hypothetical protein